MNTVMFGYVVCNEPELRIREFRLYRSYYCGLCCDLKERYGRAGQITLSYDTTFLALLLTSLYEPSDTLYSKTKCIAHPFESHPTSRNEYTRYAADINVILSYYSCIDDWNDEHSFKKKLLSLLLRGKSEKAGALLEHKVEVICGQLDKLHKMEQSGEASIDAVSGCFGEIMAEIFAYKEDVWSKTLRSMGFYLGKFIYIMDAYDDIDKDAASGSYNPLLAQRDNDHFDEDCRQILTMMMGQCCQAFETLPILENIDILRNILYSGVWSRFDQIHEENKDKDKQTVKGNEHERPL